MNESPRPSPFATTRWSVILAAGDKARPESQAALASLCRTYWSAVYVFLRRRTGDIHEAQDLTQAFFARLLEKNALAAAQPSRGRFRSFLLTSVQNFFLNERDKEKTRKRGGGRNPLSLDFTEHDSRLTFEPADPATPERLYERQWALGLLDQVMARLRAEFAAAGKSDAFEHLKSTLSGTHEQPLAEVARLLGVNENAAKAAAHRMRKRYRELLRAEVAETVAVPEDVDDEIRHLFAALHS